MEMYETRSGSVVPYIIGGIFGIIILGLGLFFTTQFSSKSEAPVAKSEVPAARCESIEPGTYTMFQSSPGFGTMVAFDSLKKPCAYSPQKETWEPLVYSAPPAAETPAKP